MIQVFSQLPFRKTPTGEIPKSTRSYTNRHSSITCKLNKIKGKNQQEAHADKALPRTTTGYGLSQKRKLINKVMENQDKPLPPHASPAKQRWTKMERQCLTGRMRMVLCKWMRMDNNNPVNLVHVDVQCCYRVVHHKQG